MHTNIAKAKPFALILRTIVLGVFAVFASVLFATGVSLLRPDSTSAATSSTINFQARLETSAGAVAPDGNYNVSFHLFSSSTAVGGTSTDTGCGTDTSCEWTEQYTYNSGAGASDARVRVVNGYLTVNLGSLTAFSGINWNQQQWLTMDIGGTVGSGAITWDGQMSPRLLMTATPYAFQAGGLSVTSGSNTDSLVMTAPASASHTITVPDETGTVCTTAGSTACTSVYAAAGGSGSYIQNGTATQAANFNVQGSSSTAAAAVIQANNGGSGDILDLKNGTGSAVASVGNTGSALFGTTTNSTTAFQVQDASSNTVLDADTTDGYVGIGTATPNAKLNISDVAFSDNFNRANNASLGSNWTKVTDAGTDFQIVSNQLKETSSDNSTSALGAYTTQGITSANYGVQSDIVFPSSSDDWLSVMGRAILNGGSDTNGYYLFASMGNQKVALYKRVGTTWTQLGASASETMVAGTTYTMKLVMNGTNLYGYWNGVLAVSTTDATYTSAGFAGVAVGLPNLANSIWDNFSITSVNPSLNVNNNFAVTANGWVGIGTTSPSYGLDLQSGNSINVTGSYLLNGANVNTAGTLSNVAYLNQANIFKDGTNSTAAFQVQNAAGANLFAADTTNGNIVLGNDGTPSALTIRGGAATGTNAAGGTITFDASNGTATGGSGDFVFRTAAATTNPITLDATSNATTSSQSSLTWSHTTTSSHGSLILIVGIGTSSSSASVSSITYNGSSLTKIGNTNCTSGGNCDEELWYMLNPSSGTHNVVVTLTGSFNIYGGAATYYNVNQTTPFGTAATNTGGGSTSNVTVATNTSQTVVDGIMEWSNGGLGSASPGQTQLWQIGGPNGGGSSKPGSVSSTTVGWTINYGNWAEVAVPMNPVASTTPDTLTDRLHITAAGNVGIDTASPQYTLDVAGTGNFSSSIQAPLLDTASAVALGIGTTNATQINLNQNTVVASNKSFTVNGAAIFKDATNSTAVFQVQNASAANLFTVDTTNNAIVLGNDGAPSALIVRGGAGSGNNVQGANLTFAASNGTGGGGSGDFIFQTAGAASNTSIALDNYQVESFGGSTNTTVTWTHTPNTSLNNILIVSVVTVRNQAVATNGVTYEGTSLTKLSSQLCGNAVFSPYCEVEMWYLVDPATTGTHQISVTLTPGSTVIAASSITYDNIDTTTPFGTVNTISGATSGNQQISNAVTTTSTKQLVLDALATDNTTTSPGGTQLWSSNGNSFVFDNGSSNGANGGTTNVTWYVNSGDYADIAVPLNPVSNSVPDTLTDRLHITASGDVGISNSNPQYTLDVAGAARVQTTTNSTTGFQVQNASGITVLTVDTTDKYIIVGKGPTGESTPALLVLDSETGSSSDPTGITGAMYYNATLNEFRCYTESEWEPCRTQPIDQNYEVDEEFLSGATTTPTTASSGGIGNYNWSSNTVNGTSCSAYSYGGGSGGAAVSAARPGILAFTTSTTASTGCRIDLSAVGTANTMAIGAGQDIKAAVAVASATNPSNILRVGMDSATTSQSRVTNAGIWWEADPANNAHWEYCYATGSAAQCAASSTSIAANTFVRLEIQIVSSTAINFFINGTETSLTGITLGTSTVVAPDVACVNDASVSSAQKCYIDYYQLRADDSLLR